METITLNKNMKMCKSQANSRLFYNDSTEIDKELSIKLNCHTNTSTNSQQAQAVEQLLNDYL